MKSILGVHLDGGGGVWGYSLLSVASSGFPQSCARQGFLIAFTPWGTGTHPCVKQKTLPQPPAGASEASLLPGVPSPLDLYEFPSPWFHFKEHFLSLRETELISGLVSQGRQPAGKGSGLPLRIVLRSPEVVDIEGWCSNLSFLSMLNNWKRHYFCH